MSSSESWRPARRPRTERFRSPCCRRRRQSMSPANAQREIDEASVVEVIDVADVAISSSTDLPNADETSNRENQEALAAELAQARAVLDALAADLRAVDAELADLATEREQHRIAVEVCTSLDKLSVLGGVA